MSHLVVSMQAMRHCMQTDVLPSVLTELDVSDSALCLVDLGELRFVVHEADNSSFRMVLFSERCHFDPSVIHPRALSTFFNRAVMFCERATEPSFSLPSVWGPWKDRSLVGFWAAPRDREYGHRRWVAQVRRPSSDVCFWELYDEQHDLDLRTYEPDAQPYFDAVAMRQIVHDQAQEIFSRRKATDQQGTDRVDLGPSIARDVVSDLSYDGWLGKLTRDQLRFVMASPEHSLKLRGPAGSGKTLTLEMKAIREARKLLEDNANEPRILFVTHSWAMAGQVDAHLTQLDAVHASMVTVLPLLALAQDSLPSDRQTGLEVAGEDSLESRQIQLSRIESLLTDFRQGDWLTFRDRCSVALVSRVDSTEEDEAAALCWDLVAEFGCVIGANGIFTGPGAEGRYLKLPRMQWMMPLPDANDRRAVFRLYKKFVDDLLAEGLVSSDQVVNDYLNFLETWAWNVRRKVEGFDLIFVDELHLFNAQERIVLKYLARDIADYPKIFMALDPRQSPWEFYTSSVAIQPGISSGIEGYESVTEVSLTTVHRFSPQILELLRHLHREFPSLELGEDWNLDFDLVESTAPNGPLPVVVRCRDRVSELTQALVRAKATSNKRDWRNAIAVADDDQFDEYRDSGLKLAAAGKISVSVISSREDIESLNYRSPRLVIAPVEYLAGMQFDKVVVTALPGGHQRGDHRGHQRRRFLSLLYLAVSRASSVVEIICSEDDGLPEVLESAIARGIVESERSQDV